MLHHCSFYWSSVKSFLANCFLIIGDHFRLHFYKSRWVALTLISWGKDENVRIQRWYCQFFCSKQKTAVVKHHVRRKIKKVMQISLFPSSNRQNIVLGGHWFTRTADVCIPNRLPQFHSFWKFIPFTDLWCQLWQLYATERVKIFFVYGLKTHIFNHSIRVWLRDA